MNFSLQLFSKKLRLAVTRFTVTFAILVGLAVIIIMAISSENENLYLRWISSGVLSALATLAFYLFAENRLKKPVSHIISLILTGLSVWFCANFPVIMPDAIGIQLAMLVVSLALALFFTAYISEKNSLKWWDFLQNTLFQLFISAFFAGVLMAGLSLAIVSLDQLFDLKINEKVYGYLAVFCFVLFMPSYFMSQLPGKGETGNSFTISYPNIFKILGLYILLPILTIYILILYGYLFKIIATWELPNGWVSWLVSILGFAGLVTMIILHPLTILSADSQKSAIHLSEARPAEKQTGGSTSEKSGLKNLFRGLGISGLFNRIFPFILLPLLVLMFVGIVRRFSDYGITINRLLILILNLWFFGISIYLIFSRSRQPKWILISFAIVAFLSSTGPWSVINITEKSLKKELSALLTEANWANTAESKITPLTTEKQVRLSDVAYYLQRIYGTESIRPMFSSLGEKADAGSLIRKLGISEEKISGDKFFTVTSPEKSFEIDFSGFNKTLYLKKQYNNNDIFISDSLKIKIENEKIIINRNNKEAIISLNPIIEVAKSEKGNLANQQENVIKTADYKLIILQLDGRRKNANEVYINYMDGLLLMK